VDELADSTSLLNDQDGLRRQLADDGYLFFRGLLPAAEVRTVGAFSYPAKVLRAVYPEDPRAQPPEQFSRLFRREPWWEPVPAGLTLYPRAQLVSVPPDRRGWSVSTPAGGTGSRPGRRTEAGRYRSDMTKVPSTYEMEGTSPGPGPAWPVARSSGAADRRRGRTPAQAAGFPGASRVPSVASGWCPFPTVKAFLLPR
jgi:hypothetical protein